MRKGMSHSAAGRLGARASKDYANRKKKERVNLYNKKPKFCPHCGGKIPYDKRENKFCSHSCSASFNNLGVCRNGKTCKDKKCIECGQKLNKHNMKYCSHDCQWKYKDKERFLRIENGDLSGIGHRGLKKYIEHRDGHYCNICGITEWMGKELVLILDHIDGDSTNNDPLNLRLVCSNCDSQLPTYKSKNNGNGRYLRRKRYRDGKSF